LPFVNIENKDDHVLINLAAPGMKKEDFNIELKNNILTISGESQVDSENENKNFSLREFNYSRFHRSFNLSNSFVDSQKIEAHYKNGILTIQLAKKEEAKIKPSRQIVIK
jgi:HSP20 family protein